MVLILSFPVVVVMLFVCANRRKKVVEQTRKAERQKTRKGQGPENLKKFTSKF